MSSIECFILLLQKWLLGDPTFQKFQFSEALTWWAIEVLVSIEVLVYGMKWLIRAH